MRLKLAPVLAFVLAFVIPGHLRADDGREDGTPPITATGADVVDIRNTSGGITRYTTIPNSSIFTTRGRRGPCNFVAFAPGTTYDGQGYAEGQQVSSTRWMFIEAKFQGRLDPNQPNGSSESYGPLSKVGRVFEARLECLRE